MTKPACTLLAIVMVVGIGCKAKPIAAAAPSSRRQVIQPMAIVDENRVFKAMGWDHEIQQAAEIADQQMRRQLNTNLQQLNQQATAARARVAKLANLNEVDTARLQNAQSLKDLYSLPLAADERQMILTTSIQTNLAVSDAKVDYRQKMEKRLAELVDSYRKFIMPAAQTVATRLGYRMAVACDRSIIYHDPSTDISQQVIEQLNRARPSWERPDGQ